MDIYIYVYVYIYIGIYISGRATGPSLKSFSGAPDFLTCRCDTMQSNPAQHNTTIQHNTMQRDTTIQYDTMLYRYNAKQVKRAKYNTTCDAIRFQRKGPSSKMYT